MDFSWYFVGAFIPAIIGFIKSPLFTRYFTPVEYGYYSLIFITFNYLSIGLYSWLLHCIKRYYYNYKKNNKINAFISNIAFLFLTSTLIVFITTLVMIISNKDQFFQRLVLCAGVQIVFTQVNAMILIIYRIQGKAYAYNFINTVKTIFSFLTLCFMTFILNYRIETLFVSLIIIDFLVLIYFVIIHNKILRYKLSMKYIEKSELKTLIRFGSASLILNLFLIIINTNDRYIIALHTTVADAGIYNQLYNLGQVTIFALIAIYENAINPELITQLENDMNNYTKYSCKFFLNYIIFLLPIAVFLSVFSFEFANIFLGEKFRVGWKILPWVFFAKFLTGLFIFSELKYKFQDKMRFLISIFVFATIVNISLNFIFIPLYGYQAAVYSNFCSYALLSVFLLWKDIKYYLSRNQIITLLPFVFVLLCFWFLTFAIKQSLHRELSLYEIIALLTLYCSVYVLLVFKYRKRLLIWE